MSEDDTQDAKERSMQARIEVLEAKVALLEEQLPVVTRGQAQPLSVDAIAEAERDRAKEWTLHYTVSHSKDNVGEWYDHKWESTYTVSGYVIDAAGHTLKWNHVTIGFNRGCSGSYPKSEHQGTQSSCDHFSREVTLTPKIDHWSGWIECRGNQGIARFAWKSKHCD